MSLLRLDRLSTNYEGNYLLRSEVPDGSGGNFVPTGAHEGKEKKKKNERGETETENGTTRKKNKVTGQGKSRNETEQGREEGRHVEFWVESATPTRPRDPVSSARFSLHLHSKTTVPAALNDHAPRCLEEDTQPRK